MPDKSASLVAVKESTLPPAISGTFDALQLYDPSTFSDKDQDNTVAAVATGAALAFLLPLFEGSLFADLLLSSLVGGGAAAYCALRKDPVGAITRDVVGDSANSFAIGTADAIEYIEEEFEVSDNIKRSSQQLVQDVKKKVKDLS